MATLAQKRRLDTTLGAPVCVVLNALARLLGALSRRDHSLTTPPRRILVIKLVGLGSILHATLLLRALKERYPDATLSFLCFTQAAPLVPRLPDLDEVILLDDRSYWRLLRSVLGFVGRAWRHRPDLVLDLEVHSKFSTILSTLTCARDRAGYYLDTTRFRGGLYTQLVYYNRQRHVQEAYRQLGRAVGADPAVGQPLPPHLSPEEQTAAERFLDECGRGARKLLLVNVNAGELCWERRWDPANFAAVIEHFAAREEVLVVLIGSPDEAEYTETVRRLVSEELRTRVVNSAGKLSFGGFLALLQAADVLLTNDTGPLHLAAALDRPTVSLWGPGLPETYRPLIGDHRVVWKGVYCSPCLYWVDEPPCAGCNVCMMRMGWEEVAAEVAALLGVAFSGPTAGSAGPPPPDERGYLEGYVVRRSVGRQATEG
jgi:ADP-heptose:LPS heptosyltransferase